jgi:hypothetical protein
MKASEYKGLTIRNGIAGVAGPVTGDQPYPPGGRNLAHSPCDRAGRVQLMREAYTALLRRERVPAA